MDLVDKSEYYYLKDNAIVTKLPEIGYMEELHNEDWYEKSYIWFYGEWLGSEEANVESNLKTMAMRIRDLLKESNHAQWKEVDDFLKQYEHMHVCDEKLIRRMVCNCHIRAWGDLYIAGIEYGDWINLLEDFSEALKKHVPFTVLYFTFFSELDVNVHPTKMELRFDNNNEIYVRTVIYVRKERPVFRV